MRQKEVEMNEKFDEINDMVERAVDKSHAGSTLEEQNALFFDEVTKWWNEAMAGEITLADGRTIEIEKI
jgi:hypothetical protein